MGGGTLGLWCGGFCFRLGCGLLGGFDAAQSGGLSFAAAQVVELRAADAAPAQNLNGTDGRRIRWKHALDADAETHPPHGETCSRGLSALPNHNPFEWLNAF